MSYMKLANIAYALGTTEAKDPLRQFDLYFDGTKSSQEGTKSPLIVFVHGGAWRSENKQEHEGLARRLLSATRCPVAVPNYRLTPPGNHDPQFRHPMHAQDLLVFLEFLQTWNSTPCGYDPSNIVVLGHSCSAHMLCAIMMDSGEPSLEPTPNILGSIKGVILSEGIYNLDKLLADHHNYLDWFVQPAFGPPKATYSDLKLSAVQWPKRHEADHVQWLLIHSPGDTLVDISQSREMHERLENLQIKAQLDTLTFREEHDDVLNSESYVRAVTDLIVNLS